jgi:hypothetical protein
MHSTHLLNRLAIVALVLLAAAGAASAVATPLLAGLALG